MTNEICGFTMSVVKSWWQKVAGRYTRQGNITRYQTGWPQNKYLEPVLFGETICISFRFLTTIDARKHFKHLVKKVSAVNKLLN